MDDLTVIPLSDYPDAEPGMPEIADDWWQYKLSDGRNLIVWKPGQQVRIAYPSRCTACWKHNSDTPEFIGLVALLTTRADAGRGGTYWRTMCPDHFASHVSKD